ncbi:MAG: hypothetical protein A2Y03_00350 [Omnitrophica WOR_2 bacterium GWF2_38_59]|nr:MAG: hypothetical protein A2Y03_00350 [Omnitrophica WOR_2 bacterium GWF2_38_59]OGX47719.1 MAG: hypothetical protein A2243_00240 [Omnitrophica WOR_2 bacterium RIFOXYA2_FULL_38_17]OGX56690.1 MAG: hypothetical protein A2306_08555 [Omnitrophica WOR_2 bacterium RIFOXYB2_FULL_38_16]OGX57750.1 MAG: hypothetical protein A2447_06610 [Omnitrophica WOR_2 bacterium RIFOXYC2_FULL_38_12]HBG60401.1 hypothetical protein [Candidatus Omnitrophota bacterium]
MYKIKYFAVVGMVIFSAAIVGCSKKVVTNKTIEEYEQKKQLEVSNVMVPEKTYENLFKEEVPVKPEQVEAKITKKAVNEPVAEVVQVQIIQTCGDIGLVTKDMCEFCTSIPGAQCLAIEKMTGGQDCYSCVEIPAVTETSDEKDVESIPEELTFETNVNEDKAKDKTIVLISKIEPENYSEDQLDYEGDDVIEISDNYKMINEDIEELVSAGQEDCTVFDLLNFSDCTECDGNCVVEELPDVDGICYRCESSTGGARCADIGLKTDCSACSDSKTCEFMELTVYLANGEKFEQSCYNCG